MGASNFFMEVYIRCTARFISIIAVCLAVVSCPEPGDNQEKSHNADLNAITLSAGVLNPVFSAAVTNYTVDVQSTTASIVATGIKADTTALVSGDSGQTVNLSTADNAVTISVTAQDGTTVKNYVLSVFRNGWEKWVDTSKGSLESDLTFSQGSGENVTITMLDSNLNWSSVSYHNRMTAGNTYTVSYTAETSRTMDFLCVYENNSAQYHRETLAANTPAPISFTVTPLSGADLNGRMSFRSYPNLSTGFVAAGTLSISNITITRQ
jgi:hypothetical protein